MLIPSIDIQDGRAVQLEGGERFVLDGGDPLALAERFSRVGEIAVVDLDAALGRGENRDLIRELCRRFKCRVGGGIRDVESAVEWLDAGAEKIVLGTAARPEILERLPGERVIAALDARHGEVVDLGWTRSTGQSIEDRIEALEGLVGGFLVTFVELEGRLGGTALDRARALRARVPELRELTIAGGISTAGEIATLDRFGCDAQVGMALYTGGLGLAEGFTAALRSDRPDGLWPTVVCDPSQRALGLVYSDLESVDRALETGQGWYHSRSRGLWHKGASSGATQELLRLEVDCDRDCLRAIVRQSGTGFCHRGSADCWGSSLGLARLGETLAARVESAPTGSYTARLLADPGLLAAKLTEEAVELAEAKGSDEVSWEAADLFYFAQVAMARAGVSLESVERELDRRVNTVNRRD